MSSDVAPLLVGFAAAGLLLVLIGIVLATRRLVDGIRRRPRRRQSRRPEGWATSQEWVYRPRAPSEGRAEPPGPAATADAGVGKPSEDGQGSSVAIEEAEHRAEELLAAAERQRVGLRRETETEAERRASEITEDARRQARELLEEAELEAKRIVVATGQERARLLNGLEQDRSALEAARAKLDSSAAIEEAEHKAKELLAAAERQCDGLRRESEAEAERIAEDARRQAQELLEETELEAKRIVVAAGQERARLVNELAQERSVLEETRTRLSGFLTGVLEEVKGAPAASEGPANVRDLNEARGVRTSAGADH